MSEEGKFCYRVNDGTEKFTGSFDTRDGAKGEAESEMEGYEALSYETGIIRERKVSSYVSPEYFMENVSEEAYDEVGESINDWEWGPSKEAVKEFLELVDAWAEKHGLQPNFWAVSDVEEHVREYTEQEKKEMGE